MHEIWNMHECACVCVFYHELLTTVPWCTIVRFLFSRYRRWQEIRIESRIAGIGIGRENDKVRETLWSGMLLGRGHLICKCTVTAGRLLSLVPNLDLDSKQRGQYFNLHLHLKLFKGWQPPSYSFTSHLSSSFIFLFFSLAAFYRWNDTYRLTSATFYNILLFKNVSKSIVSWDI